MIPVKRLDTGKTYRCIADASKETGLPWHKLNYAVSSGHPVNGIIWRRLDGQTPDPRVKWYDRPVVCLETGKHYSTLHEAARENFVFSKTLYNAILTGRRCAGYRWRYAPNL